MYERRMRVIKLVPFKRSDFKQLINWINSEEFLIQWSGNAFTYPLNEQQLEKYTECANTLAFKIMDEETKAVIGHISLGQIDNLNKSAISCYEKIGFVKEGLLRESKRVGETYWNLWEMSMLEYEWNNK